MGKISRQKQKLVWPVLGGALAALCGLLLWEMPLGAPWINASYDYLFRFGSRAVTNNVALILMDNQAFEQFHQTRGQPWDRALHAQLLNKLADDGCSMVVFDAFFAEPHDPTNDNALAAALRRQRNAVLLANQGQVTDSGLTGAEAELPAPIFLAAARTNWGVGWWDPDEDSIVRRHWPFPSPEMYPSLAWTAARLSKAELSDKPLERWLRYYGEQGSWTQMSYGFALSKPENYFRDKTVFIGSAPQTSLPNKESDEFSTPYTRWTHQSKGGVEIIVTEFLNLMNGDWLRRPSAWLEILILVVTGFSAGAGFCRMKFRVAAVTAAGVAVAVSLAAVSWSYFTNYWFPWLIISGGQIPCALAWAGFVKLREARRVETEKEEPLPETPGFELFQPPFGKGAYGNVWLAKNAAGQWRALKVIYLKHFNGDTVPYEREFNGVTRYKPVSDKHPGLLRVDFVSQKSDDYFFYAMELGDSLASDWQGEPKTYKPRDLGGERARSLGRRLPHADCIRIAIALADALTFLHENGLTHRDIKPGNVIFVNGEPKLADLGLIAEIRPENETKTFVGTPGYMPPPPEPPGTPVADIYALGMLLYVISTGNNAAFFPEIATTLVNTNEPAPYLALNAVILKACQPDVTKRYQSAVELRTALYALLNEK
ncbi:MAG TPA: CHASE2 domain-containing protein [Verrucomicrobiae bacterium]|jgi:CHASE2 domain-containing sensor protein|nr:CHASE2 domain-containing protein [Verrucomicrobiae bacterium]